MKTRLKDAGARYWLGNARLHESLVEGAPAAPKDEDGLLRLDLRIEDGRIAALAPAGSAAEAIDLRGGQVWPAPFDAHTHLDKGHIWPRTRNATGDFAGAIAAAAADRAGWTDADIEARFDWGLRASYAHGTAAIRTHLETYAPEDPASYRVFRKLRDAWAGRIELQASSIAPLDRFQGPGGDAIADLVADSGMVLGMVTRLSGGVHDELPAEFQPMLDHFFSLAEARGLALDLHVDESGETGARALREIARTALRRGFRQPIQCGHCCSLSIQPEEFARETIAAVAEAGISIVVLPMCNMYLQDRAGGRTPRWRGVTLLHEMKARGTPVAVASDNCRDPFFGYGDHDLMEVYREATRILHLDRPFADWPKVVAGTPAEVMGVADRHGRIGEGRTADLILFRSRHFSELLSRPQSDRVVLRAGRPLTDPLPDHRELDRLFHDAEADDGPGCCA
jgi:cytosine deaminase